MDLDIAGKKALILGSSGGIGKAIAGALVREGALVCLNSRSEENLKGAQRETGAKAFIKADLAQAGAARWLVEEFLRRFGAIDILVTNTGGPARGAFLEVSLSQWQHDYQSLWLSAVEALQAALPAMQKKKWGRVAMITSVAARDPLPGLTTSNGLRAGLTGLCKSVAREMAGFGITINAVLPGFTDTDRLREMKLTDEFIKSKVPAGRLGRPDELADLVAFLVSERAGYITGQAIAADGGLY